MTIRHRPIQERRTCWHCHADFTARHQDEVYCTARCGWQAHTGNQPWHRRPSWVSEPPDREAA